MGLACRFKGTDLQRIQQQPGEPFPQNTKRYVAAPTLLRASAFGVFRTMKDAACAKPTPLTFLPPSALPLEQPPTNPPSLDLRQNPLTQSLAKLLDGRDRGVVHHLIPQIRILDGAHLSGERTTVGSETLDEAIELICEGSSGARAAWAEEDAAAAAADGSATVMEGQRGGGGDDSLPRQRPSRRRRSQEGGVVALGDATRCQSRCQSPAGLGIVHWDSDLTQGGGQAFSGNPRCEVVRRSVYSIPLF